MTCTKAIGIPRRASSTLGTIDRASQVTQRGEAEPDNEVGLPHSSLVESSSDGSCGRYT